MMRAADGGRDNHLADFSEETLFEHSNVRVTTRQFIIVNVASYRLSDFVSAEVGHWKPLVSSWVAAAMLFGCFIAFMAVCSPMGLFSRLPSARSWMTADALLAGLAITAMTVIVAAFSEKKSGRHTVQVLTKSGERKAIFRSPDRELVESIVSAISTAAAQREQAAAPSQLDT